MPIWFDAKAGEMLQVCIANLTGECLFDCMYAKLCLSTTQSDVDARRVCSPQAALRWNFRPIAKRWGPLVLSSWKSVVTGGWDSTIKHMSGVTPDDYDSQPVKLEEHARDLVSNTLALLLNKLMFSLCCDV